MISKHLVRDRGRNFEHAPAAATYADEDALVLEIHIGDGELIG